MTTHPEADLTQQRLEDLSAKLPDVAAALDDETDRDLLRECFLRGADAYLDDADVKPVPISTFTLGGHGSGDNWSIGDYRGKNKNKKPPKKPPTPSY